jgi:hypothetical protein
MALVVAVYAARFAPHHLRAGHAALVGLLLALLYLTRSFEFGAVVLAWLIGAAIILALRLRPLSRPPFIALVSGAAAFVVTWVVVNAATGKRGLFLLYGNHLNQQRSTVDGQNGIVTVAHLPTFTPSFVPTKLVQLFVEPCYYSMCSISNYGGGATSARGQFVNAAGSERLWRQPLAIQLPSLILLPACIVVLAAMLVWAARHRRDVVDRARGLQGLVEMAIAATGLVLGYTASTMIGSSHLRYGLARDFLLPALLTAIVAVTLVTGGLWGFLSSRKSGRISPESVVVLLSVAGAVVMVGGAAYARAYGIPRIEGRQLGAVSYTAACRDELCNVSLDALTTGGGSLSIPDSSTLTFRCGQGRPNVTIYASSLSGPIRLTAPCPDARLTEAWPTVAGLPPGAYELHKAVRVSNA